MLPKTLAPTPTGTKPLRLSPWLRVGLFLAGMALLLPVQPAAGAREAPPSAPIPLPVPGSSRPRGGAPAAVSPATLSPVALSPAASSPGCAGGTVYDDGSFENRYTLAGEGVLDLVTRFDLPAGERQLDQVCLCWTRTGGDGTASFDLLVYAADGPGGQPGNLLTGLAGVAITDIPFFPQTAFYNLNLSALGLELPSDRVYIGASWDAVERPNVYLCADENGPTVRPAYASTDQGQSWTSLATFFPELTALGVRAQFGTGQGGGFDCVPGETTLCLRQGRFQVRMTWDSGAEGGLARVVSGISSDESGLFYFRREDNWELLVKVLDGCPLNNHYWVFFAAVTNVEYTLTVVDSETGLSQEYRNPLGRSSPAITDTAAFATCP